MPIFEVELYELHVATWEVEAPSKVEAIKLACDLKGELLEDSLAFVQLADKYGIRDASLRQPDASPGDDFIPAVRGIVELSHDDDDDEDT